jgi:hypothetical protein
MRSRAMLKRLDRFTVNEPNEIAVPNLSVLSPWEYDRLMILREQLQANDVGPAEFREIEALFAKCPIRKEGDKFAPIEIPSSLQRYWQFRQGAEGWRHRELHRLNMVERALFLELCVVYGWEEDVADSTAGMTPLSQWNVEDKAEMKALLDLAGGIGRGSGPHHHQQ